MKCVLHIGAEKTGTTVLQNFLYQNQKRLSASGIYLSDVLGKTNNRLFSQFFQSEIDEYTARMVGVRTPEEKDRFFEGFLDRVSGDIKCAEKDHSVFVITSEHFHSWVKTREEISALSRFLHSVFQEVEIVCYFRNQFDVVVSHYSTALRTNSVATLDQYVDSALPEVYYYDYLSVAGHWSGVFGEDQCIFRIYDLDKLCCGDIRRDFLALIGCSQSVSEFDFDQVDCNEALGFVEAMIFRKINAHIPFWSEREGGVNNRNLQLKAAISRLLRDAKLGRISSDRRGEVEKRFEKINRQFFLKYFGCENQFLTDDAVNRPEYPGDHLL